MVASLRLVLEGAGYGVHVCRSAADLRRCLPRAHADACLLDVRLPDGNGIELLPLIAEQRPLAPVIMISGHAHDRRRGGGHARGRLRFPREAAGPRPAAPRGEERPRAGEPAPGERAPARDCGRRAPHDRLQRGVPACRGAGHAGGAVRRARAADGRVGHRQGTARRAHSPQQPVRGRPVREGELRGDPGGPARERAVRPREGRVHRRDLEPARQVRAGRRRDHLPRRGARPARVVAGQAAARAPGRGVPARRRRPDAPRLGARHRGDEPGPGRAGRGEEVPRGPLLPAERRAHPGPAAEGAARGRPAARGVLRGRVLPPQQLPAQADRSPGCSRNCAPTAGPATSANCAT